MYAGKIQCTDIGTKLGIVLSLIIFGFQHYSRKQLLVTKGYRVKRMELKVVIYTSAVLLVSSDRRGCGGVAAMSCCTFFSLRV